MKGESRLAQLERVDAGHAEVDRFCVSVKAILGDTGGVSAKEFVCSGGAVAANDVDLAAGMADRRGEIGEDIVQTRIEMANVARPMIAQEIIEFGKGVRKVLVALAVNDINPVASMSVVEQQEVILALVRRRGRFAQLGARAARRHQQEEGACNPRTPRNHARCVHILSFDDFSRIGRCERV